MFTIEQKISMTIAQLERELENARTRCESHRAAGNEELAQKAHGEVLGLAYAIGAVRVML